MSDLGIETPRADAAEQQQDAIAEAADAVTGPAGPPPLEVSEADAAGQQEDANPAEADAVTPPAGGPPLEASAADVADQQLSLGTGDDEYR